VFKSSCYTLKDRENLHKFDNKSDKEIFLWYSSHSKAYNVYNLQTQTSMEPINVVVDDNLKEFVKEDLGNIIEITEETLSE